MTIHLENGGSTTAPTLKLSLSSAQETETVAGPGSDRACGDCIACCVYLKIPEIEKRGLTHCKHLSLPGPIMKNRLYLKGKSQCGNCKIHESKPEVCQGYRCLWLDGHGAEQDRPDISHILADTIKAAEGSIVCKQLAEGAATTKHGMDAIVRISRSTGMVALVPSFYEQKLEHVVGRPL